MKIKAVCQETGLTPRTIRFYEAQGLIAPASETRNGRQYREYSPEDLAALQHIAALRRAMFSLEEIRRMQTAPDQIGPVLAEYQTRMSQLAVQAAFLAQAASALSPEDMGDYQTLAEALVQAAGQASRPPRQIAPHFGRFDPEVTVQTWDKRRNLEKQMQSQNAALLIQAMTSADQQSQVTRQVRIAGGASPAVQQFAVIQGLQNTLADEPGVNVPSRTTPKAVLIGALCLVLVLAVLLARVPVTIDRDLTGVCWMESDGAYVRRATVHISGVYWRSLLLDNTFYGQLYFDGISREDNLLDLTFTYSKRGCCESALTYYRPAENQVTGIGDILVTGNFRQVTLRILPDKLSLDLPEETAQSSGVVYITAPASDRAAAVQLTGRQQERLQLDFTFTE